MADVRPEVAADQLPEKPKPVRLRAVLWGLGFCIPVCYWNAWQPTGTIYSLLFSTMAALIVLVAINAFLHRVAPKIAFTTPDMVVIFAIVSVASAISGEWTFLNMQYVHVFAGYSHLDPLYEQQFLKALPESMYFHDPALLNDYIAGGNDRFYFLSRLDIWLPKILMWVLLYGMITISLLCLNSIMRDAWLRKERLSYPIIQLPVAMIENSGRGPLWKSKAMWIAFGIMFAIDMLNGFAYLYPNLPSVPVKEAFNFNTVFTELPWRAMGSTPIAIYPFLAAMALLVPSDLLFSVIFFFVVRKLTLVACAMFGLEGGTFAGGFLRPEAPYFTEQTWGAIIGLFATAMWVARSHLKQVWSDIKSGARASDGGIPHRLAFGILIVCFAGVLWFTSLGELPILMMIPYFGAFLMFSIVIARMRAQLGPPTHEFAFMGPNQLLMNFYGTKNLTPKNAVFLGAPLLGINRLSRSHCMPVQLEAMKMADSQRVHQGAVFWLLALGLVVGILVGMLFFVQANYVRGAGPGWGDPVSVFRGVTDKPTGPNVIGMMMVFVGFAVVTILDVIRFNFPAFKLHPVGYALSMNFGVDYYWFGLVAALMVKTLVQRYYGLRGYRQLRNVAFGIMIAEYGAELIWATYAMATRQSTYTIGFNERGLGTQ
ncbi:MAG: hypothetical protein KIT74_03515 [Fimbriimonadales bacterium]|nr:hypothetical protein [Fimbriimonadales bacterium]